jgi:hypothetical protein
MLASRRPLTTCWPTLTCTELTVPALAKERSARRFGSTVPVLPTVCLIVREVTSTVRSVMLPVAGFVSRQATTPAVASRTITEMPATTQIRRLVRLDLIACLRGTFGSPQVTTEGTRWPLDRTRAWPRGLSRHWAAAVCQL